MFSFEIREAYVQKYVLVKGSYIGLSPLIVLLAFRMRVNAQRLTRGKRATVCVKLPLLLILLTSSTNKFQESLY